MRTKSADLFYWVTVVDTGSFSAAADLLDIPVAKVSRAIARLERQLDCTLLNRTTRRLELTEEGKVFLEYARQGLDTLEQGEQALQILRNAPSGLLRVDAASPFVLHQLVPLVSDFRRQYPDIRLDLTSHDNIIDLIEHKTDIAIRIGDPKDSNLHARVLGRSQLHLVASPEYLGQHPAINAIGDLRDHALLGFSNAPALNRWPLSEPVALSFGLTASSGETLRQLCLNGQGIALLSNFMCRDDIQRGRLCEVLPGAVVSPNRRESVQAMYYKNSAVSSRIQVFLDFIHSRLKL